MFHITAFDIAVASASRARASASASATHAGKDVQHFLMIIILFGRVVGVLIIGVQMVLIH